MRCRPESDLFKQKDEEGKGWSVFGLYAFGKKHARNAALCPRTLQVSTLLLFLVVPLLGSLLVLWRFLPLFDSICRAL